MEGQKHSAKTITLFHTYWRKKLFFTRVNLVSGKMSQELETRIYYFQSLFFIPIHSKIMKRLSTAYQLNVRYSLTFIPPFVG